MKPKVHIQDLGNSLSLFGQSTTNKFIRVVGVGNDAKVCAKLRNIFFIFFR